MPHNKGALLIGQAAGTLSETAPWLPRAGRLVV